jgi:ankyrin repeat protein
VQDESGYTPLYASTMYGKEATVAECIKLGAQVDLENNNGVTPLMAAARDGYTSIVKMLLEAGADCYQVDEFGRTADSVAEEKGFEEVRRLTFDLMLALRAGSPLVPLRTSLFSFLSSILSLFALPSTGMHIAMWRLTVLARSCWSLRRPPSSRNG